MSDRQLDKRRRREERERELADKTMLASQDLGQQMYNVIYADPPWRFEPYSRVTGMDRAADNHYPTMSRAQIAALQVPAAPDCALFLWATVPMLTEALHIMRSWGFTYKSNLCWVKSKIGTGYWSRNQHELLLIGTRGSVPAPAPGTQFASVVRADNMRHSQKPVEFYEIIERYSPVAPKLEMFARSRREGWDAWGNEV